MIPLGVLASARVAAVGGGFLPTDISGLVAWYKADAITGVADGANAATWPDSSGNAYHMSLGRKYLAAGANGLPCIEVNASNRFAAPTFNMQQPNQSIVAVVYLAGGAQNQSIAAPSGTGAPELGFDSSGKPYFGFYSAAPTGAQSAAALAQTTWGVVGGSYSDDANLFSVRLDGVETTASTTSSPTNSRSLGFAGWPNGGAKLVGRIAEIVYYHATLTAQQFADVESYLAAKYGL